jgi:hypothetical protein
MKPLTAMERAYALPPGTIAKIGGAAAAELARAIEADPHDPLVVETLAALSGGWGESKA